VKRPLRLALCSAAAFIALCAPACAEDFWGEGVEVMQEEELSDLRGGIAIAGIDINFGAVITTYLNGTPVITTQLTWTDAGAVVEETVGSVGQNIDDLTDEARAALGIDGLEGANGIVIDDEAGITALVHNVTNGALQGIIINNATGRDLRQDIDITLTAPGFDLVQSALITELVGIRLDDDLRGFLFGP
jgi:hypothetical protein